MYSLVRSLLVEVVCHVRRQRMWQMHRADSVPVVAHDHDQPAHTQLFSATHVPQGLQQLFQAGQTMMIF